MPNPVQPPPGALRLNNFDAVRLCAALLVIWGHQFAVMGKPVPHLWNNEPGALGVIIFFAISGYLVTLSWNADPHAGRFALRRALRIWPGLAVAVLLCVFVLGPLFTTLSLRDYFATDGTWHYLSNLYLNTRYPLPGVFEGLPLPATVNGPLWTIRIEAWCYLAVLVAGCLRLLRWRGAAPLAFLMLALALQWHNSPTPGMALPAWSFGLQYGMVFALGATLASFPTAMRCKFRALALLGAAALALHLWGPQPLTDQAPLLALGGSAVILGSAATPWLTGAARFGDMSYGLYIYGFPAQQAVMMLGGGQWGFPLSLGLSLVLTFTLAALSWHLVERPSLALKPGTRPPRDPAAFPNKPLVSP